MFFLTFFCKGCGYQMGNLTPPNIHSIAVPIFQNDTLFRDFEFDLTQAVVDEILTKTSLVVTGEGQADSILVGRILKISFSTITKNDEREATILDISATVDIHWQNARTGKTIIRRTLTETAEAIADRGENVESATDEAFQDLAQKIVYNLEGSPFSEVEVLPEVAPLYESNELNYGY